MLGGGRRPRACATRRAGGVASVLNELAEASACRSRSTRPPFRCSGRCGRPARCSGLDPLYVANEGVAVAIVAAEDVEAVLAAARPTGSGAQAAVVGEVAEGPARVSVRTGLGATRPLIMLAGDQLPRIC